MTKDEALKLLEDAEVVPCVTAGIADIKEVLEACLAAGIPAVLDRQECAGHTCVPRIDLCVRPDDLPKVVAMMQERWRNLLAQEDTLQELDCKGTACEGQDQEPEDPPCPACGLVAPLVNGACRECGLQLE